MTIEETAAELNVSPATVKREWTTALLWLRHEMSASREWRPSDANAE
jgi:hypothetical protein